MKYSDMIREAKSKGLATEAMMWDSVEDVEMMLCRMKEEHPKEYWSFLRKQHGRIYKNHYTEDFAEHDVSKLTWTDKEGKRHEGGHWTLEQVKDATKGMTFPAGTTDCDKYVAFNASFSDLCKVVEDERTIIKIAFQFWFADEDAPEGKVWIYMCAMHTNGKAYDKH